MKAFAGSAPMNRIQEKQIVDDKEKAVGQETLRTENTKVNEPRQAANVDSLNVKENTTLPKVWYVSVNYLQNSEDTAVFEELESKDDYKGMLQKARNYDFSADNNWKLRNTFKDCPKHYLSDETVDDNIMTEDEDYAIVKHASASLFFPKEISYSIFRKVTEDELLAQCHHQGYGDYPIVDYRAQVIDQNHYEVVHLSHDVIDFINSKVHEKYLAEQQNTEQQADSLKPVDDQLKEDGLDDSKSLLPSDEDKKQFDSSKEEFVAVKPSAANNEQTYYAEVAAYMNSEDVQMFDEIKANESSLLTLARQCDPGDAIDQEYTHKSPYQSKGDKLLAEDDNYAVVFNDQSGSNSYIVLRKISESDVRLNIDRFGLSPDASDDVLDVAKRYDAERNTLKAESGKAVQQQQAKENAVAQQKKGSKEEDSKILFDGTREEAWSIVDAIQPYIDDPDITVLLDEWLKATDGYGTPFNTDKEWYKKYAKGKTDHQLVNLYHNAKDFLELVSKEDDKKAVDPIMRVYDQMKAEHPNTILLFKSKDGKSCNSYSDDASKVSEILQLPLFISYDVKDKDGKFVDNCIFPSHDLGTYLPMLY